MKEIAETLLKIKAVTLRVNPPFKWVSGILAPIYTDNRLLMSYPEERELINSKFLESIKENNLKPDAIAGIATSGIPWAAWIADKLNLPLIYIRKKTKDHGKENLLEGKLEKGQNVLVVEDLVSTGGSSINGVKAVKSAEGNVIANMAIFSYELEESKSNFKKENVNLIVLTDISELTETAAEKEYITAEEKDQIIQWRKNPKGWKNE